MIEDLMGPGIQGEDARPDGISSLVNQVDTVAVTRDPDARDLARVYPGAFEGLADGALTVLPDLIHVLFDPARIRAQAFSNASAFTVFSQRPVSAYSRTASATILTEFSQVSVVVPAICGVRVTFSSSSQGLSSPKGSSSWTSRAAPAMRPSLRTS